MNEFASLLQQGNAWLFIPSAILLGALHGLEPGHSKTMMAAFIIAIKGTIRQAVMLGLAATLSHTVIVWLIALGGMFISRRFTVGSVAPWLQLISAMVIVATAIWMFLRTWRGAQGGLAHDHHHPHGHDEHRALVTAFGTLDLSIAECQRGAYFQLRSREGALRPADTPVLHVDRGDGTEEQYRFQPQNGYLESVTAIPEPHRFAVRLVWDAVTPHQCVSTVFQEEGGETQDAHARAHAAQIERHFAGKSVTDGQILLFGLTGGLIPCPAAITILLICLQIKAVTLGATMVLCFSLGLALTLVTIGVAAAISVRQVSRRWPGMDAMAAKAPYISSLLIGMVGVYMGIHGYAGITG